MKIFDNQRRNPTIYETNGVAPPAGSVFLGNQTFVEVDGFTCRIFCDETYVNTEYPSLQFNRAIFDALFATEGTTITDFLCAANNVCFVSYNHDLVRNIAGNMNKSTRMQHMTNYADFREVHFLTDY